jgi:peptidyl-prolyl cis-trans isomerase SurA
MQEQVPRWTASLRADAKLTYHACPNSSSAASKNTASSVEQPSRRSTSAQQSLPTKSLDIEVEAALEQWRRAWSKQGVKAYFAAYSRHFNPGQRYADISAWKQAREKIINSKKYIHIDIRHVKITHLEKDRARIEFDQHYEADALKSHDLKLLLMEKTASGWKIIREMTAVSGS